MMELELENGTKIYLATSEVIAFKPAGDGTTVVLRPNPGVLDGSSQVTVKTPVGRMRDAYNIARRVT